MWQPPRGAILVCVDGSAAALGAVRWAARDAVLRNAPLTLVHISDAPLPEWFEATAMAGGRQRPELGAIEAATEIADACAANCGPLQIDSKVFNSATIPTLVGLSAEVEMVVVGYRGRGGVSARGLGSVSSALVYSAHCPVAVIHGNQTMIDGAAREPVLVGIDGSPASEAATAIAFAEASRRGVGLLALHVWTDPWVSGSRTSFQDSSWDARPSEEEESLAERLAGWHERYPDVAIHRSIEIGDPARCLIEASRQAQLLVVGSHGCSRFRGTVLGSVGASAVNKAKVPVIVARQS
ncbi:universal stress protein [Mycobacterium camsae]|uniref:universal stress protein n=1 Tax=Mycobacterium gordonae TaxID=1778 RepID=UPI00197DC146|nr:universal stress protein [Mycobacterium gordonae]